ncbi:MAG: hypothetical protein FWD16_02905, partial [Clostridia bacterium]|nr:hypothetical protein [Clostridia bacterium]
DPDNPGVVWCAWNAAHNLPELTTGMSPTNRTYQTGTGGICVSYDSGYSWLSKSKGIERTRFLAMSVMIDRTSPKDNRTLYACAMGGKEFSSQYGVYRSTDNGENWTPFEDGIDYENPKNNVSKMRAWRFFRSEKDNRIYLNFATNGWDHIDNPTRTFERGATYYIDPGQDKWTKCNWPVRNGGNRVINEIAVNPNNPDIIYVTGRAAVINAQVMLGGAYKSTNGGKTWTSIVPENQNCMAIRIDPRDNNILYLTTLNGFIYVSYDAGESWIQSKEYNNHVAPNLAYPDWRDKTPSHMFVCTGGGSLFYGPIPPKDGEKFIWK